MKSVQDAFYNWLSIKVVSDARPSDKAARDTFLQFDEILKKDYEVDEVLRVEQNEKLYFIYYKFQGEEKSIRFPKDLVDFILREVEREPEKYPIIEE